MEFELWDNYSWKAWTDPYDNLNFWTRVVIGILTPTLLVIGSVLLLGMISFERYGEDPQKRGLQNQVQYVLLMTIRTYGTYFLLRSSLKWPGTS